MKPARLATLVVLLPLAFAACGGSASTGPSAAPSAAPTASPTALPVTPTPGAASSAPAAGRVSANTASQAELAAAFSAAGIPNADRWAREVTEYRPYPTDDPTWGQLRQELGKYNIDPATLEQIIALLEP